MAVNVSAPLRNIHKERAASSRLLLLLGPAVLLVTILFGGGLILGLLQALGHQPGSGFDGLTLHHFKSLTTDPDFGKSLRLTFYLSLTSTCIAGTISICLALLLRNLSGKNRFLHFLIQLPLTVPHLAVSVAILLLLAPTGLIARLCELTGVTYFYSSFPLLVNDPGGIGIITVYVWKEIPFITLMLLAVLKNMGPELGEAGATLGAGQWKRFKYITLPTLLPSLSGGCLIVFAYTFGAFEVPYLLGQTHPVPLSVWAYKNYSDIDLLLRPEGIALGLIITALVTITLAGANLLFFRDDAEGRT
jgi:putative spermidine/putrescine transport system permease protein